MVLFWVYSCLRPHLHIQVLKFDSFCIFETVNAPTVAGRTVRSYLLGHKLNRKGVKPAEQKVLAIANWPARSCIKEVHSTIDSTVRERNAAYMETKRGRII